ncbi:acid protease [Vararia minispora EC-137]|uniref:Acid protease n=1 Tax=Vararia minispora EC-137 TaxID=1314806 RepID=A0ACB8QZI5_9AGAM|nr:acid protease [Vararia minispora EC-137]
MIFTSAFIAASLPFIAALPTPLKVSRGLPIPLSKRDAARRADDGSLLTVCSKVHRGIAAYEVNTGATHSLASLVSTPLVKRQAGSGGDILTDDQQVLWFGTIQVGTPPVQYTVDFDTGSSDLFLPGPTCGTTCSNHTVYNPASSSTSSDLGKTFSLAYGDGSTVSGKQFTDVVAISGSTATNQTLGSANQYSSGFQSPNFPADGLMGMGFPSISVYGANPVFQTLVASGVITEPVFSFKLATEGSELFIGGTDANLFTGNFTFVNVTQQGYWQVEMDALTVNGQNVIPIAQTSSIIDTGTTLIVGDTQTVATAYRSIQGATDNGDGTYTVPCNATPNLSLTFGGRSFSVDPATFILGSSSGATTGCIGGLSYNDAIAGQFWIIGDVFLQNVYTQFDVGKGQVGFAALSSSSIHEGVTCKIEVVDEVPRD